MVNSATFIKDIFNFIKIDLIANLTDPISSKRSADSRFIMTSYPERFVQYPLVTIKLINQTAKRSGMQTEAMDVEIFLEIRIWARNQLEKDNLANSIYKRLRDIQFIAGGSEVNNLHDFQLLSAIEIDESGDNAPKSRILQTKYKFFDI